MDWSYVDLCVGGNAKWDLTTSRQLGRTPGRNRELRALPPHVHYEEPGVSFQQAWGHCLHDCVCGGIYWASSQPAMTATPAHSTQSGLVLGHPVMTANVWLSGSQTTTPPTSWTLHQQKAAAVWGKGYCWAALTSQWQKGKKNCLTHFLPIMYYLSTLNILKLCSLIKGLICRGLTF